MYTENENRKWNLLLYLSSISLPLAVHFYLYVNNHLYIEFEPVLIIAGIILAVFSAFYALFYWVSPSAMNAWQGCLTVSVYLFASSWMITSLKTTFKMQENDAFFLISGVVLIVILNILLKRIQISFLKDMTIFSVVFAGIFFLFNLISAIQIRPNLNVEEEKIKAVLSEKIIYPFDTNSDIKKPNIYWIHADGMLSFSAVEKYFGDPQTAFYIDLIERGFMVNKDAAFEAGHSTRIAVPALMSPNIYDQYLADALKQEIVIKSVLEKNQEFMNITSYGRYHNEVIMLFQNSNYRSILIYGLNSEVFPARIHHSIFSRSHSQIIESISIKNALTDTFDLPTILEQTQEYIEKFEYPLYVSSKPYFKILIIEAKKYFATINTTEVQFTGTSIQKEKAFFDYSLNVILEKVKDEDMLFVYMPLMTTHQPFFVNKYGEQIIDDTKSKKVTDYYPQHQFATNSLIEIIDIILASDPNAVIIIQGDHGLHGNTEQDFYVAFGADAVPTELWNSVISAVRIPQQYQNGEEAYMMITPLNISRYLVNNFIGQAYTYIE